ncbi:MAG: iron ABC transporter permease [Thermodesulfobacteriota bacterium]
MNAIAARLNDWFYISLLIISLVIAAALSIPLIYLFVKTIGTGDEALEIIFRWRTFNIIVRTLVLAFSVTIVSALISVPLAWFLFRTNIPLRRLWLTLTVIPLVIPSYVGGFIMVAAFGPTGLFQSMLSSFGVERLPEIYGFWGSLIVLSVLRFPYMLLPVSASLSKLDVSLEEVSHSLGYSTFKTFFKVILPQLKPAIATGGVFTSLMVLSDFGAVSLLRYETFTWAIYVQYQSAFNFDVAAVLSTLVLLLASIFIIFESRIRKNELSSGTSKLRRSFSSYIDIGAWKTPVILFLTALVLLSLVIPSAVLFYWLYLGITTGQAFSNVLSMAFNSLTISLVAAVVIVITAFPIAYFSCRYQGKMSRFLENIVYVGYALPGVVVALSIVFLGIRFLRPLYQTYILLIAAYVILFLPICIGTMRNLILQINTNLEDAARSLGKNRFQVIARITLPLIKPGILAGFILAFLLTMRELPSTLILSPYGFRTLATGIWSATSETFLAAGAMYSLVLMLVASVPMVFILLKRINN